MSQRIEAAVLRDAGVLGTAPQPIAGVADLPIVTHRLSENEGLQGMDYEITLAQQTAKRNRCELGDVANHLIKALRPL